MAPKTSPSRVTVTEQPQMGHAAVSDVGPIIFCRVAS